MNMDPTSTSLPAPHGSAAAAAAPGHAAHGDPSAHAPQPSGWPLLLAFGIGLFATSFFLLASGYHIMPLFYLSALICVLIPALGWATTIARERHHQDPVYTYKILRRGFFYFLLSEGAIFGSFFAHNLYLRYAHAKTWPPVGAPYLDPHLAAIGTMLLVFSSFTYHWCHQAFLKGKKALAKNWLLATIGLGIIFLCIQGYDWGTLKAFDKFTYQHGAFGSEFYWMTGFHGLHVCVGLLFLSLVYYRMETNQIDQTYNFSLTAAEYYWHFVDIVWVLLFFVIYLL
jgi:cytochrome c oxidase subunit 3